MWRRGFRDPRGAIVVRLRLDVGPHIFGGHQSDVVTMSGEQVMSTAAGLHSDDGRRKLLRQPNQGLSSHLTPRDDRAGRIEANDTTHVLGKTDVHDRNIHTHSSATL
jgi:hypothetical protein